MFLGHLAGIHLAVTLVEKLSYRCLGCKAGIVCEWKARARNLATDAASPHKGGPSALPHRQTSEHCRNSATNLAPNNHPHCHLNCQLSTIPRKLTFIVRFLLVRTPTTISTMAGDIEIECRAAMHHLTLKERFAFGTFAAFDMYPEPQAALQFWAAVYEKLHDTCRSIRNGTATLSSIRDTTEVFEPLKKLKEKKKMSKKKNNITTVRFLDTVATTQTRTEPVTLTVTDYTTASVPTISDFGFSPVASGMPRIPSAPNPTPGLPTFDTSPHSGSSKTFDSLTSAPLGLILSCILFISFLGYFYRYSRRLRKDNERLSADNARVRIDNAVLRRLTKKRATAIADARTDNARLRVNNAVLRTVTKKRAIAIEEEERKRQKVEQDLISTTSTLKSNRDKNTKRIEDLKREKGVLDSEITKLGMKVKDQETALADKDTQISVLGSDIANVRKELDGVKTNGSKKDEEVVKLKNTCDELQKAVKQAEKANAEAQKTQNSQKTLIDQREAQLKTQGAGVVKRQTEIKQLKEEIEKLKKWQREYEAETVEEISKLKEQGLASKTQLEQATQDRKQLESAAGDSKRKAEETEKKLTGLQSKIKELEEQCLASKNQLEQATQERNQLESAAGHSKRKAEETEENSARLQSKIRELEDARRRSEAETAGLRTSLQQQQQILFETKRATDAQASDNGAEIDIIGSDSNAGNEEAETAQKEEKAAESKLSPQATQTLSGSEGATDAQPIESGAEINPSVSGFKAGLEEAQSTQKEEGSRLSPQETDNPSETEPATDAQPSGIGAEIKTSGSGSNAGLEEAQTAQEEEEPAVPKTSGSADAGKASDDRVGLQQSMWAHSDGETDDLAPQRRGCGAGIRTPGRRGNGMGVQTRPTPGPTPYPKKTLIVKNEKAEQKTFPVKNEKAELAKRMQELEQEMGMRRRGGTTTPSPQTPRMPATHAESAYNGSPRPASSTPNPPANAPTGPRSGNTTTSSGTHGGLPFTPRGRSNGRDGQHSRSANGGEARWWY